MNSAGPDFTDVDMDAARALCEQGDLAALMLLPERFGGTAAVENVVYVPHFVIAVKERLDDQVMDLFAAQRVKRYAAKPIHQGRSAVPMALEIRAYDPEELNADIAIWGEALER